jgi:glutaredoxin
MMGFKEDLVAAARRGAGAASKQVMARLNRADELGGDLRDYLLSRTDQPILRRIGERMAKFGGVVIEDEAKESEHEKRLREEAAVAPPPTAAAMAEAAAKKGLGDEDIAAQVYGRKSCPWTGRAITLLNEGKVDFDFVDMDDSENGHFEAKLVAETKQDTIPYVYLRGGFVGGYNELNEVVRLGQLEYRTLSAEDQKAADATRSKVNITPRNN